MVTKKQVERIYWDSNCFIEWFNGESDNNFQDCNAIIDAAKDNKIELFTSILTLVEVAKIRGYFSIEAEDKIVDFFRNSYI